MPNKYFIETLAKDLANFYKPGMTIDALYNHMYEWTKDMEILTKAALVWATGIEGYSHEINKEPSILRPAFTQKENANELLSKMQKILDEIGYVTIEDLKWFSVVPLVISVDDNKWGWTDLSKAFVDGYTDTSGRLLGWELILPQPFLLPNVNTFRG